MKAQLVDTAWNGIIPALYAKKFDVIISAMTITKERAEKVLFSMPYADASNVILLRANEDKIKTADDLSGKIVGVQIGSAAAGIIKTFEAKLKAAGKPGYADVKQYEHYPEAYQDLLNKRIDAVVNSQIHHAGRDEGRARQVQDDRRRFRHHRLFRHGLPQGGRRASSAFVNEQLAGMKKDGTLAKLQEKWFGATMETPNTVPEVLP